MAWCENHNHMHLIGLDIGFSATQRTNALAELRDGELRVVRLNVNERDAELAQLRDVDVIAIDAPIVPAACSIDTPRLTVTMPVREVVVCAERSRAQSRSTAMHKVLFISRTAAMALHGG